MEGKFIANAVTETAPCEKTRHLIDESLQHMANYLQAPLHSAKYIGLIDRQMSIVHFQHEG